VFITSLKTVLVETLNATFSVDNYPERDFENVTISIEYPMAEKDYPGIWVDFAPSQPIQVAGINHVEWTSPDENGHRMQTTVWRYAGTIQFTCVALTSLERDRLVDEMVKVLAFGLLNPERAVFRQKLIGNDLIAIDPQWDKFAINGKDENQGTPWNTSEVIYEQTVSMDCTGSFYVEPTSLVMVPLSAIKVYEYIEGQTPPVLPA
jgi:hypothetical protein